MLYLRMCNVNEWTLCSNVNLVETFFLLVKMYTDESEEESEEVDVYRKKYQLIVERCEVIQQVCSLYMNVGYAQH